MKWDLKHLLLTGGLLLLAACGQSTVDEPALDSEPAAEVAIEEPTAEPTAVPPTATPEPPTATPEPTNTATPEPTETPTPIPTATESAIEEEVEEDEGIQAVGAAEDEAMGDLAEGFEDLFGFDVVTEGQFTMESLGVSFELPEGWSATQMMGIMAMVMNQTLDFEEGMAAEPGDGAVALMFVPSADGAMEELSELPAEDFVELMDLDTAQLDPETMQVLEDRVPVTINGYEGIRYVMLGDSNGTEMRMEITYLENEESGYTMVYMGAPDEVELERANYDQLMSTLVLTPPNQEALADAGEELIEGMADMFGEGIVTEGRIDLPVIGVSFEVPTGWMAMDMFGFMGMATNNSLDNIQLDSTGQQDGVVVMFTLGEGTTFDEAWGSETAEEIAETMAGGGDGLGTAPADVEVIEDRTPITLNGYNAERLSMRMTVEDQPMFMDFIILEHEGATYSMIYTGSLEDYDAEQSNFEALINSLVLTTPDPEAMDFGDFGDEGLDFGDDTFGSFNVEPPTIVEPMSLNTTMPHTTNTDTGYQVAVEVGKTYIIHLYGEGDSELLLFPEGGAEIGSHDLRAGGTETFLWTADTDSIVISGQYFDGSDGDVKISIFEAIALGSSSETIDVADGEVALVIGTDDEIDVKLAATSDATMLEVDDTYAGAEALLLQEAGSYSVSVADWLSGDPAGSLFYAIVNGDDCCTLP